MNLVEKEDKSKELKHTEMPTKGTPVSKATNKSVILLNKLQSSETDNAVKVHQSTKLCITGLCG